MNPLAPGFLLGQLAPSDTTAAALYTATIRTEVTCIFVCNVTGTAATFRLHHDEGGSTYAVGNALYYDVSVPANTTTVISPGELGVSINLAPADTLGVRSGTGAALTFTAYGVVAPQK